MLHGMIGLCVGPNRPKPNMRVLTWKTGQTYVWDITHMTSQKRSSVGSKQKLNSLIECLIIVNRKLLTC